MAAVLEAMVMELTCPHCAARYRVPEGAVPPEGRTIQCAKCGESWFEDGAARARAQAEIADIMVESGELGEHVPDVGAVPPPPLPIGPATERAPAWDEPEPRGGGLGMVGWILLLLVIGLLAAGGYAYWAGLLKLP